MAGKGKAKRITLSGIKPVKQKELPRLSKTSKAAMDKQERDWRAEDDARTLGRAAEIYADPKRFKGARGAAERLIKEEQARLSNLRAITRKGAP